MWQQIRKLFLGSPKIDLPLKILLDRNIRSLAITTEPVAQQRIIEWGGKRQKIEIIGWARKPPPKQDRSWMGVQTECLPTIARLSKEGKIKLYTSKELEFEAWSTGLGMKGTIGDLFRAVKIECLQPAVDRSYFASQDIKQITDRERVRNFCRFLEKLDVSALENEALIWSTFPTWMQRNLKSLDRFKEICGSLDDKHYPDALHLWTAEVNNLDCYLTADGKFIRALKKSSQLRLPVNPLSPEDFLTELKIIKRDHLPITDFKYHSVFEDSLDHFAQQRPHEKFRKVFFKLFHFLRTGRGPL